MTRNFLNSTGRAAVLAAFLLGVFLPAGARAQGNGQALVQAPEHKRDGSMWLRIMAFADAPVVGAEVRVSVYGPYGWPLVDVPAATNQYGVFPAAVPSHLSSFRVTVSGGTINGQPFPGRLSRDVVLTDPAHQIVVINPVTTLVSRLLDVRPELKLDQAEALVRHLLKLPENYSLGLALRQSSHYVSPFFSPVAFMAEARAVGGLDAFLHLLLQELASPSTGHPFRPPQLLLQELRSPSVTHPLRPPQLLGSTVSSNDVSVSSDAISIMKTGLYAGLLDVASAEGVGNLAGWALSYTNLATPGAIGADIAGLQQSLTDLQSSIDNLSSQVGQLTQLVQAIAIQNTQTQYITITTTAQTLANQVYDEENRLMYLANDCPPLPAGSTPTPPDPGSFCDTEPGQILNALSSEPIYSSYTNVEGYVQDNGPLGVQGMIHLYSLWLSQSKRFFRPADSTKMQNLYDYWDGVLTQAADLKVELLHRQKEQDAGGATLMGFMGNPNATPPSTGTFQLNENANQHLMFPAVPLRTVVDTKTRLMWETDMPTILPGFSCFVPSGSGDPPPTASYPYIGYYSWNGFTDWTSPVIEDLQTLVEGSGGDPLGWLINQTEAVAPDYPQSKGFPDIIDEPYLPPYNCTSQTAAWSVDPAPMPPNSDPIYYVFDFKTGATEV